MPFHPTFFSHSFYAAGVPNFFPITKYGILLSWDGVMNFGLPRKLFSYCIFSGYPKNFFCEME